MRFLRYLGYAVAGFLGLVVFTSVLAYVLCSRSDAYATAYKFAASDPAVLESVGGSVKDSRMSYRDFNISIRDSSGSAFFTMLVTGSKEAEVFFRLVKSDGEWSITRAVLLNGKDEKILVGP